jgi:hypothetical protein
MLLLQFVMIQDQLISVLCIAANIVFLLTIFKGAGNDPLQLSAMHDI